ncbi:MAG TPA: hydroxymethylbilane synthase [Microlunatus sp.]|nr:hydroxymethylbilane synthase [Microlunatus sp.]
MTSLGSSPTTTIRIGARTSPLARAQADQVAASLRARGVDTEFVGITTTGDVDQRSLTQIGGTGVFVGAVREALYAGRIDVAVHSLKDLPTAPAPELDVAAVPPREDPRDVLIGRTLDTLRDGDRIGTGSPRRAIQLGALAERLGITLEVVEIRGNVDTRIGRAAGGDVAAVVLAAAGLRRLGHLSSADADNGDHDAVTTVKGQAAQILSVDDMVPAPGQAALALEIHESLSEPARAAVRALDDPAGRAESLAERAFLAFLEAGCTAPVGARAVLEGVRGRDLDLTMRVVIGRTVLNNLSESTNTASLLRRRLSGTTTDPGQFGAEAATAILDELRMPQRARHR